MRKQFFFLVTLAFTQPVFSQSDSALFASAFQPKVSANAGDPLFYGQHYLGYPYVVKGNPFYGTEDWQQGSIIYRDITYENVMLKYEQVRGEVIVLHPNGFTPVALFSPRIQSFNLGEKRFVYLEETDVTPYKAGIYEVLSTGPISLYAKRSMLLNEIIVSNTLEREFVADHSFYVQKDGKFLPIKKEKAIMQLVGEKRKESKAVLKAAGVKFRKNPEEALLRIVNFYNQSSR
ncbi:MAG TPA: hypothetical protein VGN63_22325 [Flavisolibacter sp.]|jgi:hypothetical protein|nr:hypothetical protein [Flavisolibacter sp.]